MYAIKKLNDTAESIASKFYWTNTYGVARSVLAFGMLLTLLNNNIHELLSPLPVGGEANEYRSLAEYSLYHLFPNHIDLVWAFSVFVIFLALIGWRPRIVGFFHWWVAFSYVNASLIIDGGDQITALLTFLILPVCLADPRKWHWTNDPSTKPQTYWHKVTSIVVLSCFLVVQLQVAFIYFHAGIGKLNVEEWINGTAVYYWFNHPNFGLSPFLKTFFDPILTNAFTVTLLNWGVLLLEVLLFLGLTISKKWRPTLLLLGLVFHFMIIVVHGLVSFFFAMAGALLLYLGPIDTGFQFPIKIGNFIKKQFKRNATPALEPSLYFFKKTNSKIVKS